MKTSLERVIVFSSGGLLMVTALLKIIALFGADRLLEIYDPLFLLKNRSIFAGLALVEISCAVAIFRSNSAATRGLLLLWLSLNFILYRLARFLGGIEPPCPCLGNIGSYIGLRAQDTELVSKLLVTYFLMCGLYFLLKAWPFPRTARSTFLRGFYESS